MMCQTWAPSHTDKSRHCQSNPGTPCIAQGRQGASAVPNMRGQARNFCNLCHVIERDYSGDPSMPWVAGPAECQCCAPYALACQRTRACSATGAALLWRLQQTAKHMEVMAKGAVSTAVPWTSAAGPQYIGCCLEAEKPRYTRRQGPETANAVHIIAIRMQKSDSCCYAAILARSEHRTLHSPPHKCSLADHGIRRPIWAQTPGRWG